MTQKYEYICPMCFTKVETIEPFLKCCNHAMVDFEYWQQYKSIWLVSRDFEISQLLPSQQERYRAMEVPNA